MRFLFKFKHFIIKVMQSHYFKTLLFLKYNILDFHIHLTAKNFDLKNFTCKKIYEYEYLISFFDSQVKSPSHNLNR